MKPTLKQRAKDFLTNKEKYQIEYRMIEYTIMAFVFLLLVEAFAYYGFFRNDPTFLAKYGWWFFYGTLSIVSVGAAMWHLKAYRTTVNCMVGMMIGMTIGMQSGMMIGAVLGATNGMFIGALVGMLFASAVGWYTGSCCGIMGVMEGIMAGIMGGTMGAMIAVMMLGDHLLWFMPPFMILNLIVMWGLSYMLFEEIVEDNEVEKKPIEFATFFSYCFIAMFILGLIMLYGPKSALVLL